MAAVKRRMTPEGTPEYALLAEEYVVGACLLNGASSVEAAQDVDPQDFWNERFGRIYAACVSVAVRGGEPTIAIVAGELEQRGELDTVGAEPELVRLAGDIDRWKAFVPVAVRAHARMIRDHAERRRVLQLAQAAARAASRGDIDEARRLLQPSSHHLYDNPLYEGELEPVD